MDDAVRFQKHPRPDITVDCFSPCAVRKNVCEMLSIFPGARFVAIYARISSIGSLERRHAKKDGKLRQFKPFFVLVKSAFAAAEELAPLGLGRGIQVP